MPSPQNPPQNSRPRRLLSKQEVIDLTGCSYASLFGWMKRGLFPLAIELGPRHGRTAKDLKPIAAEIAAGFLADAWRRRMNYFVMSARGREPPPFPTTWQRKNLFGVNFDVKTERAEAEAWITTALIAGFIVFHSSTRDCGSGRSILDWDRAKKDWGRRGGDVS